MSSQVINVEGVSKQYRIGLGPKVEYRTMRESIYEAMARPVQQLRACVRSTNGNGSRDRRALDDTVWALQGVSFEVSRGEVLGIVGRNGAGKSTLLKILSRITPPTCGRIGTLGRVGSLLEVGTGFHPELTGRENVYLNGAILGMSRREISRKFDEITAFADIDRYLDTPVKRYSSGMYTRLAFAVASHLEPEILIVDEVLAVGDAQFQKKCLGRMNEVSREGRTVLFVSHNMSAMKSLCTRCILIEAGRIAYDGSVDEAINRYLNVEGERARTGVIPEDAPRYRDLKDEARARSVRLTDCDGKVVNQLYFGQPFRVVLTCDVMKPIEDASIEISISTLDGTHVSYSTNTDGGVDPVLLSVGRHEICAEFELFLLPRDYTIDVGIHHHQNGATSDLVRRTLDFTVLRVAESGDDHYRWPKTRGLLRAPARWKWSASVSVNNQRMVVSDLNGHA
jgi:lipopolysaccharide transport system ATP-binding protein